MIIKINGIDVEVDNTKVSEALEKGTEVEASNDKLVAKTDDMVVKPKAEFDQYVDNLTKERYEAGREKAEKDKVNAVAEKHGLDLSEQKKTVENLVEKLNAKLAEEHQKEPNQKIEELENEKQQLQQKIQDWQKNHDELKNQYTTEKKQMQKQQLIQNHMPNEKFTIPAEDVKSLFQSKYDIDFDENNNPIVKQNGETLKDENLNPRKPEDVMKEFSQNYITKPAGGGAGGDEPGGAQAGTYEDFVNRQKEAGNNPGSEEFNNQMKQEIEQGTLKL